METDRVTACKVMLFGLFGSAVITTGIAKCLTGNTNWEHADVERGRGKRRKGEERTDG